MPHLVRRSDGTMVLVPRLVYEVARTADGRSTLGAMAARVSAVMDRSLCAEDVAFLVEAKLTPAGLLEGRPPPAAVAPPRAGLLSLGMRTAVVPQGLVSRGAGFLRPLFRPQVVLAMLIAVVGVDAWLVLGQGLTPGVRASLATPALLFVVGGLTVVAAGFHELGHAAACRYGGAEPGAIGVGVYLFWPAFFSDLTESYRLSRRGRLRADLGGIYFNLVFVVMVAAAYAVTSFEPLLMVIAIQHVVVLEQFLPFLRLDGYYVLSDLFGVPDLFGRIKPVLTGLLRGQARGTADLEPKARAAVLTWVALTVPTLVVSLVVLVVRLPSLAVFAGESFVAHAGLVADAWAVSNVPVAFINVVQMAVLVLPVLGMAVLAARAGRSVLDARASG